MLTFILRGQVDPGDVVCIQFYNIIMRSCLQTLGFEQLGRHFYDAGAAIYPGHRLTLWPGYITTLRQHEEKLLLCVEVTHKVLRQDSCLDIIRSTTDKQRIADELVGNVVITLYNKKTYIVDDIDWDRNPDTTFQKKDGTEISFYRYYKDRYPNLIDASFDRKQPLLVSMPSKQDYHRGDAEPQSVLLVPQLCNMTGLSQKQREDYRVMNDLNVHLQLPPDRRVSRITAFMDRLRSSAPVTKFVLVVASSTCSIYKTPKTAVICPRKVFTFPYII